MWWYTEIVKLICEIIILIIGNLFINSKILTDKYNM